MIERITRAGFPLANKDVLYERPIGRVVCHENELIFNRALDGKSSAFCVLATIERDGSVVLHHYNPDPNGLQLKRDEFLIKTRLASDASEEQVAAAVERIVLDAAKKKLNEFFFVPHTHFGALSPPYSGSDGKIIKPKTVDYDDGVSYLTDDLRKAMFYHTDYYSLTTHNSFPREIFRFLSWAGHALGVQAVPGIELTAPLKEPNGPHFLIWMRNSNVGEQVRRTILNRRERLDMPSYFSGMDIHQMLEILFKFQAQNLVALGIAHPVNFNSPHLPIPIVGLYTAVDTGAITLQEAVDYASRFDSIAMWNPSLYAKVEEVPIKSEKLKRLLRRINQERIGNKRLWVNQTNYALAEELHEAFGLHTHFETDEHKTLPFVPDKTSGGYILGGDRLAMGMTVITVPEDKFQQSPHRPNVGEFIDLIRSKAVGMCGRVFAVKRPEAITVHAERAAIPDKLRGYSKQAEWAVMGRYARMLIGGFLSFLSDGGFDEIGNMPGD